MRRDITKVEVILSREEERRVLRATVISVTAAFAYAAAEFHLKPTTLTSRTELHPRGGEIILPSGDELLVPLTDGESIKVSGERRILRDGGLRRARQLEQWTADK